MIDCPKCGFTQPEDRYCANCGVDMEAFKAPVPPLLGRVLRHWIFQVSLLLVAIVVALVVIEAHRRSELAMRSATAGAAPDSRTDERKARDASAPAEAKPAKSADVAESPGDGGYEEDLPGTPPAEFPPSAFGAPDAARVSGVSGAAPAAAPAPAAASGAVASAPAAAPKSLRIYLGEFKRQFVAELAASAREDASVNAYGQYTGGVAQIADLVARIGREGSSPASSTDSLAVGQTISIFKGVRDAQSRNVGFTVLVTPTAIDENAIALNVEVVRAMRDAPSGSVQEQSFPDTFTIRAQRVAFMTGLVPHRAPDQVERELYASTPLNILSSQQYQAGATEFAALFVPQP